MEKAEEPSHEDQPSLVKMVREKNKLGCILYKMPVYSENEAGKLSFKQGDKKKDPTDLDLKCSVLSS